MNLEGALGCCAVCNIESHRFCARCRNAYYCNKEHQREHWKTHKIECLPKTPKSETNKFSQIDRPQCDRAKSEHSVVNSENNNVNKVNKVSKAVKKSEKLKKESKPTTKLNNTLIIEDKQTVKKASDKQQGTKDSVISTVVCPNSETSCKSAITYEGSSEKEILSELAQELSTVGYLGITNGVKSVKSSVDNIMAVMPELPRRLGPRDYPEAALKSASMYNSYVDHSDPCYEICQRVIRDMSTYGVCVLDNFLGRDRGLLVRKEVLDMYKSGIFQAGQLVSDPGGTGAQSVRSDRITWIDGREPHCHNIGTLINQVDSIILRANKMPNNGKIGDYIINTRTKAMVACYPGSGSNYVKHVDNPNRDGRCVTAIYYLNLDWNTARSGGLLRVYPEGTDQVANIEPIFDRMLFFWSDRRNPHEVQPAFDTRYAITLWYFDAQEREEALRLYKARGIRPSSSRR